MTEKQPKYYYVQLPDVLAKKQFSNHTRLLAANLMNNPYMSVGNYLTNLSKADLDYMSGLTEAGDSDPETQELMIITLMLLQAEGTIVACEDDVIDHLSTFKMMIAGASLGRKGLIKVNYENISFNTDMEDLVVFEKN